MVYITTKGFGGWPLLSFGRPPIAETFESTCIYEPPHDKTNKMACAPSEDSDQPGHPPSLIRAFPHEESLGP